MSAMPTLSAEKIQELAARLFNMVAEKDGKDPRADIKKVKLILVEAGDQAVDVVNTKDNKGKTLLHVNPNLEVAKLLVQHGANIDAKNRRGYTALHFAASYNLIHIAKFLIEEGADVSARSDNGNTPLHFTETPIIAQLLMQYGADVTAKNDKNETPLHLTNNCEVADILIQHGADVNAKANNGETAFNLAVQNGKYAIAEFLQAHSNHIKEKTKISPSEKSDDTQKISWANRHAKRDKSSSPEPSKRIKTGHLGI